jgi:hypothetical protein
MSNNKQQTVVEWLRQELLKRDMDVSVRELFEKAKEMEKQRIAKAFTDGKGQNFSFYDKTGEQYYNETYGDDKQ